MTSRSLPTSGTLKFCDMKYLLQCLTVMVILEKDYQYTNYKKLKRFKYINFLPTWYAMDGSLFRNLIVHYPRLALAPEQKIHI